MIRSFKCRETERLFERLRSTKFPSDIQPVALRKLRMLRAVRTLRDLRVPPANQLEALKGNRKGRYSIWINDRWRIWFRWERGNAFDMEIVDYH
jgi:proteic killer suppression protein